MDYFYEPLSPEDQAKFDKEDRREYGIFEEESSENRSTNPTLRDVSNRLAHIKEAAAIYGTPVLPNPLARKVKKPNHSQPLKLLLLKENQSGRQCSVRDEFEPPVPVATEHAPIENHF